MPYPNALSITPWIAPTAILISTSAASFFAFTAIKSNRQLTKKSSTMKFIMDRSRDETFFKSINVITKIDSDRNSDIRFYADKNTLHDQIQAEKNETKRNKKKQIDHRKRKA